MNNEDKTFLVDSYRKQVTLNNQVRVQMRSLIINMDNMIKLHKEIGNKINEKF